MNAEHFIQEQVAATMQIMNRVEKLKGHDLQFLTWRKNESSWNVLECLEHLNLYGDYYLSQLEDKIRHSKFPTEENYKAGVLGGYFARSMAPKEKLNKMKTFKDKNPLNIPLDTSVIDRFLNQQTRLLDLLKQARTVSLNKVKIESSISRLIRMNLGDTIQFYINHILRHLKQIERIVVEKSESEINPAIKNHFFEPDREHLRANSVLKTNESHSQEVF